MRIAILGARGFLGSYLTEFLFHNHYVMPVYRETVDLENFFAVDNWLLENKPDVVVNCAISGGGKNVNDINYSDVQRNLNMFFSFYNSSRNFKYINIGSGAEFDRSKNITNAWEHAIFDNTPIDTYGFSKNVIAKAVLKRDNFYTLRLFGCFDASEPDIRVFKKFKRDGKITIEDKYFDMISAEDFGRIVEYFCKNSPTVNDVNCVYETKTLLSEQLKLFAKYHVPHGSITTLVKEGRNYSGYGAALAGLSIPLLGLEESIKRYE
jgi:GDP-L-fucose synthase